MALIVKPQPFTREVDRLFDAFFGVGGERDSRRWVPAMDLVEADDHFVLKADLPGLAEDDVALEVQDGTLTLTGERSGEDVGEGGGWVRIERAYGGFSRSLTLPDGVERRRHRRRFRPWGAHDPDPQAGRAQAAPRGDRLRQRHNTTHGGEHGHGEVAE